MDRVMMEQRLDRLCTEWSYFEPSTGDAYELAHEIELVVEELSGGQINEG